LGIAHLEVITRVSGSLILKTAKLLYLKAVTK